MTAKPKIIVIDTNVWLDFYLPGRAGGEIAVAAIEAAYQQNVTMLYTTAQAKDIFFIAGANLKALERAKSGNLSPTSVAAINAMCWRHAPVAAITPRDLLVLLEAFSTEGH